MRAPIYKLAIIFIALFSLLFTQCAMASYVCPSSKMSGAMNMVVGGDMAAMTNCHGMDSEQPALCHAHAQDQVGKQSLEQPEIPQVAPFLPITLVQEIFIDLTLVDHPTIAGLPAFETQQNAPPIAILHCCFRI